MPYSSVFELPKYVLQYSSKIQRMWMKVFNKTYNKVIEDNDGEKEAEARAFRMANGIVGKNINKFGAGRYEHKDWMLYLVDRFCSK